MTDPLYSKLGITPASARAMRLLDFIVVPIVFFAVMAAIDIHFILTAGDWDFWVDWKDRLYWPMISVISTMMLAAGVQSILWRMFRLPVGATMTLFALALMAWFGRYTQFHGWSFFPMSMVWPALFLPSALVLDAVLATSRNWLMTAVVGAMGFAVVFPIANWVILAPFNLPVELMGTDVTVADMMGFGYVRGGMPEYLRIIEGPGLRVMSQGETWYIASTFAGFVCIFIYALWWWIGSLLSNPATVRNPLRKWSGLKADAADESDGLQVEQYPLANKAK